jgi:hypothetical protein
LFAIAVSEPIPATPEMPAMRFAQCRDSHSVDIANLCRGERREPQAKANPPPSAAICCAETGFFSPLFCLIALQYNRRIMFRKISVNLLIIIKNIVISR